MDVFFILFFEKFEEVGNEGFFQEVALEPAINKEIYDSVRTEEHQMLRYVWLADIERVLKIANALYSLDEFFEDLDPNRMGNDFEEFDSFLDRYHIVAFSLDL